MKIKKSKMQARRGTHHHTGWPGMGSGITARGGRWKGGLQQCIRHRGMLHADGVPHNISKEAGREETMAETTNERTYSETEIAERLARELPHWTFERGWIRRRFRTHGWKGTLMVINVVGHLAEAAWHHPDITASYAWVEVRLMTHTAKGITDKDFALARKIEEVVQWKPGPDDAPLEGTPEGDVRFAYIKYDR